MTIPINALTKISGDTNDNALLPIFTNSDVSGDYGAGLLVDLDFSDPEGAGSYTGLFANGDKIVNSAWEHVRRRLLPTATKETLSLTISGSRTPEQIKVERTARGYPHIMATRSAGSGVIRFDLPSAIVAYIIANPTHEYRVSIEETITRIDTWTDNPGNTEFVFHTTNSSTGNLLVRIEGRNSGSSGARPFDSRRLTFTTVPDLGSTTGDHYKSIGVSGWGGTVPASVSEVTAGWMWGPGGSGGLNQARSSIARRLIVEDITVSNAALTAAISAGSPTSEVQTSAAAGIRQLNVWTQRCASTDYYFGDSAVATLD